MLKTDNFVCAFPNAPSSRLRCLAGVTTAIRLIFDRRSTAIRPFDGLRYIIIIIIETFVTRLLQSKTNTSATCCCCCCCCYYYYYYYYYFLPLFNQTISKRSLQVKLCLLKVA